MTQVMRRLLVAATVFVAVNVWAADPWEKSYKTWDAKEVRNILNDSPWSKPIEIERKEKKKHGLEAPAGAPTVAGAREEDEEDEREEKDHGRGRGEEKKKEDEVKFVVRWVSSRTLREASVRGQVLQGKIAEAEADKYLPPPAEDYELALVGIDMSSFQNIEESTLRDRTYLIAKKSKETITASQVEIVRSSDGKRINAIVFHFPKKSASGQAIVSPDEKELKFVIRTGAIEIKESFDPQKMIDPQGMDL
jgi:hypothetical protein